MARSNSSDCVLILVVDQEELSWLRLNRQKTHLSVRSRSNGGRYMRFYNARDVAKSQASIFDPTTMN